MLGLALLLLVTGCGATTATSERPAGRRTTVVTLPPEPPGIRLSFIQQRFEEGTRRAGITVMNYAGRPLAVRRIGLDWPGYPGPTQRRRYLVPSGTTVDLRYRLPDPDCSADLPAARPVGVVVSRHATVRRRIDAEGLRFLTRIWRTDCEQRLLARTVRLQYAGPWRRTTTGGEPALVGRLALRRVGGRQPVALTQVQGSPLFDLALGRPRRLGPRAGYGAVPLVVTSGGRCDPHSRAAVTTPFTFRVWGRIGSRPVTVVAVPDPRSQVRMLAFLDDVCAAQ